jgi:hypothetical protein
MVVDKSTAVMGYTGETPTPLAANHHTVCKVASRNDPNYASVIGALRSIASSVLSRGDNAASNDELASLRDLLGVIGTPEDDLDVSRSARKEGTCQRFFNCDEVCNWLQSKSRQIPWAHAQPGGGKSTLCSFVIDDLLKAGHHCSYFFFRYGQHNKESTSNMLRSLAYQTSLQLPRFRRTLVDLASSGTRLSSANASTIWNKLFAPHLARAKTEGGIHWVLDGLDEAESAQSVIELISRVAKFETPVRILVFSRPLANINQAFQVAKKKIFVTDMPLPDNRSDIQSVVADEIAYLLSGEGFKEAAVKEITDRAQGSFLWASLVTKRVVNCHREEQVKRILDSTPDGMQDLYDRMMGAVMDLELDKDQTLAKLLLTWAMYARTPVTVEELSEIYPAELSTIMDLNHTVSQVCGQFVIVDAQGRVTLVHHSAREYLKRSKRGPFALDSEHANEGLLGKCLATLCDKGLRRKLHMLKVPQFLPYAAKSWAFHLETSSPDSNQVLGALVKFFSGPYPLAEKSPMLHRPTHLSLLETWVIDLIKLPAKFGRHLAERPSLIYECIPALSPASSIIHQKFSKNPTAALTVSGLLNDEWDDCIARVSGGLGRALDVVASPYTWRWQAMNREGPSLFGTQTFSRSVRCSAWANKYGHSPSATLALF